MTHTKRTRRDVLLTASGVLSVSVAGCLGDGPLDQIEDAQDEEADAPGEDEDVGPPDEDTPEQDDTPMEDPEEDVDEEDPVEEEDEEEDEEEGYDIPDDEIRPPEHWENMSEERVLTYQTQQFEIQEYRWEQNVEARHQTEPRGHEWGNFDWGVTAVVKNIGPADGDPLGQEDAKLTIALYVYDSGEDSTELVQRNESEERLEKGETEEIKIGFNIDDVPMSEVEEYYFVA